MSPFRLMSLALRHPDAGLLALRADLAREAAALPPSPAGPPLRRFMAWWRAAAGPELARHYVATFDLSRRTPLDLTYYTHGDRRQRGLALLDLRRRYAREGLELDTGELPDHLPVVLEFAALAPEAGGALLAGMRPSIEVLRLGLERAGSPYADLLLALCLTLPALQDDEAAEVARLALEGPPVESVGLEPFAPPEVMPDPVRRAPAACGAPPGRSVA